jgi:hypothetical protein
MRNLAKTLIVVLLFVCVFCPASFGEKFVMKSGEQITGEIVSYDGKTFRVKSPMGILSIELIDVEKIEGNAEEGVLSIFTGVPSSYEPDRVTGTIEYIREGEMRIKTTYGYVVVYTLPKVTGIDLKPKVPPESGKKGRAAKVQLRSEPTTIASKDEIAYWIRKNGFNHPAEISIGSVFSGSIQGDFQHEYELQTLEREPVVINHATGLMWQQAGSTDSMTWERAQAYIDQLNTWKYAGFSDWRLPTIEELISLLEFTKKSGDYYIDPIFETKGDYYWSADKDSSGAAWVASFSGGGVGCRSLLNFYSYVRGVRSRQ